MAVWCHVCHVYLFSCLCVYHQIIVVLKRGYSGSVYDLRSLSHGAQPLQCPAGGVPWAKRPSSTANWWLWYSGRVFSILPSYSKSRPRCNDCQFVSQVVGRSDLWRPPRVALLSSAPERRCPKSRHFTSPPLDGALTLPAGRHYLANESWVSFPADTARFAARSCLSSRRDSARDLRSARPAPNDDDDDRLESQRRLLQGAMRGLAAAFSQGPAGYVLDPVIWGADEPRTTWRVRKSIRWQMAQIARYYDRCSFKSHQIDDRDANWRVHFSKSPSDSFLVLLWSRSLISFLYRSTQSILNDTRAAGRRQRYDCLIGNVIQITLPPPIWFISTQVTERPQMGPNLSTLCVKLPVWSAICIRCWRAKAGGPGHKKYQSSGFVCHLAWPIDKLGAVVIWAFHCAVQSVPRSECGKLQGPWHPMRRSHILVPDTHCLLCILE